jgi:hypothetical protein
MIRVCVAAEGPGFIRFEGVGLVEEQWYLACDAVMRNIVGALRP